MFPSASEDLVKRLGQANSYRRQYFKYRELHHLKLSQGLGPSDHLTDPDGASTVASSIPQNMKGSEHHAQNAVVLGTDAGSEDGMSQTSFATTVIGSDRLRIPPLPVEAESGPFQCPYCYMVIDTPSPNSWRYEAGWYMYIYKLISRSLMRNKQEPCVRRLETVYMSSHSLP
jgi:hypothetical protein